MKIEMILIVELVTIVTATIAIKIYKDDKMITIMFYKSRLLRVL